MQYIYTMKGLGKVHPPDAVVLKDIWLSFLPGAKIGVTMPPPVFTEPPTTTVPLTDAPTVGTGLEASSVSVVLLMCIYTIYGTGLQMCAIGKWMIDRMAAGREW